MLTVAQMFRALRLGGLTSVRQLSEIVDPVGHEPPIPKPKIDPNESLEKKRARLLYQSRKRGMLENDLILSTFAAKYLKDMDSTLLLQYDYLINTPSNDWDIYYWAVGKKPVPPEFDLDVMRMLKDHVKAADVDRSRMPDLV